MTVIIETEDPNKLPDVTMVDSPARINSLVASLRSLKSNAHFKSYCELIEKEIEKKRDSILLEKDDREINRTIGFVKGMRYALDIDPFIRIYEARSQRIYDSKNKGTEQKSKKS